MINLALIALGGSVGAMARYGLSGYISRAFTENFPLGTFTVNMLGSLLIGILMEMSESTTIPPEWRSFLMIGLLGAFTTFSAFSLETVQLIRDNETGIAMLNAVGSIVFGLLFVYAGLYAGKIIHSTCRWWWRSSTQKKTLSGSCRSSMRASRKV